MIRCLLIAFLLSHHALTLAAAPTLRGIQSCIHAHAQESVFLEAISFDERTVEPLSHGRSATLTEHRGHQIGYINQTTHPALVIDKRASPLANSRLINISSDEFKALLAHEQLDLNQPADWIWLQDQSKQKFICVVLNQSMGKATKLAVFMDVAWPHRTYFYAAHH